MKELFLNAADRIGKILDCFEFKLRSVTGPQHFSREGGKLGFKNTVLILLNFIKKTQTIELDNFYKITGADVNVSKQAFSEARQQIEPMAIKELFDVALEDVPHTALATFKGYTVVGIDGSTIALDNVPGLIEHFGRSGPKSTSCTGRISIACDTVNGIILDAAICEYAKGERQLATEHVENVIKLGIEKPLFTMDRGYAGKKLLSQIDDAGGKYILRVRSRWMQRLVQGTKSGEWGSFTYNNKTYRVRVIKLTTPLDGELILFSNVAEFSEEDFRQAYELRWPVETKYDVIKNKLQLENFTGKTVISVKQDFWATMLLANLLAFAKLETDKRITENDRLKENKHQYQANTNILIGKLKDNLILMLLCDDPIKRHQMFEAIIERVAKNGKVPKTRNKSSPRKSKRQKKKFNYCSKSAL